MTSNAGDPRIPWVALNMTQRLDPGVIVSLVEHFGGAWQAVRAGKAALAQCPHVGPAGAKHVLDAAARIDDAAAEIETAHRNGADILTYDSPYYPGPLRAIPEPPPALYIKGTYQLDDDRAVAIVGTRRCTGYGRDMARELAAGLARNGFTVVSGLAHGIDSAAHQGALRAGGRTIAVLGAGLLHLYPQINAQLAEEIAARGALITEFPMDTGPERYNFPRRNRIISGLSLGVVVVEAPEKSGALITAGYALEQGREVFAVPGNVSNPLNAGPHRLIREGAALTESVDDILSVFHLPPAQKELDLAPNLPESERRILDLIAAEPVTFDELCRRGGCSPAEAAPALTILEMKGFIRQLPGKLFVRQG